MEPEDPWRARVDTNREFLREGLHVNNELLDSLMTKRLKSGAVLLTQTDKEETSIDSNALTNSAKVDALVIILRFKGPKKETFNLLCHSLYEIKRDWIVQELIGSDPRGSHGESDHVSDRKQIEGTPQRSTEHV